MNKEVVETNRAPKAIGPYSQAIILGNMVYTSGQLPISLDSGTIVDDTIASQTRRSLENLSNVLTASGSCRECIVKTTVFIKDMDLFKDMNEVYETFFQKPYPSRSCVEVARLPKDALIEIEAIAYIPD